MLSHLLPKNSGKGGGKRMNTRKGTNGLTDIRGGVLFVKSKKTAIIFSFILLALLIIAPAALAVGYAGQSGPYDTKAVVNTLGTVTNGVYDSEVVVMFTPKNGTKTYAVYRYNLAGASTPFDSILWKRTFDKVGECQVTASVDTQLGVVTSMSLGTCNSVDNTKYSWGTDNTYNYVKFSDRNVEAYKEYYYFVDDSDSGYSGGFPSNSSGIDLNKYVVAPAFPPIQTRHGNYSEYTNACNACHGLHSSKHVKLLKAPTSTDLCGTCHDGTGSKYDEVRGYVRTGPTWSNRAFASAGPFGDRLKQGSGVQTTSVHNVMRVRSDLVTNDNPQGDSLNTSSVVANSARIWQAPGFYSRNGDDSKRWLGCINCHEPHNKNKNYRLLRGEFNDRKNIVVRGVSATNVYSNDANINERGDWQMRYMYTKYLSGGSDTNNNFTNNPAGRGGAMGGIVSFCTACHVGFAVEPRANSTMSITDPSIIFAAPKSTNFDCGSGANCTDPYPGTDPGSDRVPSGAHKHPVDVEAYLAPVIEGQISSGGDICTPNPADSTGSITGYVYGVWNSSTNSVKSGCKQGRVMDPILPLEGVDGSGSDKQGYWKNKVVCLSCHVPHGSGSERIEVAWKNNGLNDTTGGSRDNITGYLWNRDVNNQSFMGSSEYQHPSSPGQVSPQFGTGSQRPDLFVDTSPYWTQFGFSSALARFNPFASACYRCHSRTTN